MGLTPNPPPDDGTLRMSGVPPSGPRSTRGFQPLTKPVAGLRPLGSRSLTRGRRAFPLPPQQTPPGVGRAGAPVPPISPSAKPAEFAASLSGPLDEIGSPSAAALPMLPPAALPPSHPRPRRLAGGMARPPAQPKSRSAPHESTRPRFHPPRQQARRRARQARPRRNRRRHRSQKPHPRRSEEHT